MNSFVEKIWLLILLLPNAVLAQNKNLDPEAYKPAIQIPGFEGFSKVTKAVGNEAAVQVPYIAEYLAALYKYAVGAGAVIAAFMIAVGGFQYIASAGIPKNVAAAKKRIQNALVGFLLLLGSYVFLYSINPDLVKLKSISVLKVEKIELPPEEGPDIRFENESVVVCYRKAETGKLKDKEPTCEKWCADHTDKSSWPRSNGSTVDYDKTEQISQSSGLIPIKNIRVQPDVIAALKSAGAVADVSGYEIHVSSGYRDLAGQLKLACDRPEDFENGLVARPGSSNHGLGLAVDVYLVKKLVNETLTCVGTGKCKEGSEDWKKSAKGARTLLRFMNAAGFLRLKSEIWHFEFDTAGSELCKDENTCPMPPLP